MSKTSTKKKRTKQTSTAIVDLLDTAFQDNGEREDASDHRRVFKEALVAQLASDDNPGAGPLYHTVSQIGDFCMLEDAIRRAGFAQGFLACRQLLVGELDLSTLKGRAR